MQAFEVGEVVGDDVDEIVARSRHEMARENVWAAGEPRFEGAERIVVLPLERDLDENVDAKPDCLGIDHGTIAADHARRFEALDPTRAGGRRQADTHGEIDGCEPPILRQDPDDLAIEAIQLHEITAKELFRARIMRERRVVQSRNHGNTMKFDYIMRQSS
jgi:hypothetical protein